MLFRCCLSAALIFLLSWVELFAESSDPRAIAREGGYASSLSVYPGDSLTFYISSAASNLYVNIFRYGKTKEFVTAYPDLTGDLQIVRDSSYYYGCRWNPTLKIKIPGYWKAGMYLAEFPTSSDSVNPVFFIVKQKDPLLRSDILVDVSFNTMNAYNNFGGKCSYPAFSSAKKFSTNLSFLRPLYSNYYHGICRGNFFCYEAKLLNWLGRNGYKADVAADMDLDRDPSLLYSYKVLIIAGHSEYWSWRMRANVESFIKQGGNVMFLSGNNCWWQVRYDNDYKTMICYKSNNDPIAASNQLLRTNKWIDIKRENSFTGLSFENGGEINYGPYLRDSLGYGGYITENDQHWVFKGTGLKNGDIFGWRGDSSVAGYEVDGALFRFVNGIPVVTGQDKTPKDFRILGITPASSTAPPANLPSHYLYGTIGIYKDPGGGGVVFNAGTVRWIWGLYSNTDIVSIVTKNVLDRFLSNRFPPEITDFSPYTVKDTTILHTEVMLSRRNIELKSGGLQEFKVSAADYSGLDVNILWKVNDSVVSNSRSFIFNSSYYPGGKYKIAAVVYNSSDSSEVEWNVKTSIGTGIAITSPPDSILFLGQLYNFQLKAYDYYKRPVQFKIYYIPAWAKYDSVNRTIYGIPNHIGRDSLLIKTSDDLGHSDTQTFDLEIERSRMLNFLNSAPDNYVLYQNYPNPFNNSTHLSFYLMDRASVELNIYDIQGRKVKKYDFSDLSPGFQTAVWNARSDAGYDLPSGIYICQIIVINNSRTVATFENKMEYLK